LRKSTTSALLTDSAEWWVLRQDQDKELAPPDENNKEQAQSDSSTRSSKSASLCPGLVESWCGTEPDAEPGMPTRWFQRSPFSPLRRQCAGRRHRYAWNGFDLDLAYITSRIIAMGFPGSGSTSAYRNPRGEVARFLAWAHGEKFRIYNLCCEKEHASNGFPDSTVRFPCTDHCPPTLPALLGFCRDVAEWLAADPENVIAVHCKAGKGRTGTMICSLLVFAGAAPSAHAALRWYELMRGGGERSGVTIPGQIRWVAMFERWLRCRTSRLSSDPMGVAHLHRLRSLRLGSLHCSPGGSGAVSVRAGLCSREDVQHSKVGYWYTEAVCSPCNEPFEVSFPNEPGIAWEQHDGLLVVHLKLKANTLKMKVWWHHSFLRQLPLHEGGGYELLVTKEWINGLHYDWEDKLVPAEFFLQAIFDNVYPVSSL